MLFDCSSYVPAIEINTIFASNKLTESNPDALRRFLKGWFEAVGYMKAHRDESLSIGAKATDNTPAVLGRSYDALMSKFSTDGKFHRDGLDTLAKSFIELKTLDHPVDMSTLYTEKFLPAGSS